MSSNNTNHYSSPRVDSGALSLQTSEMTLSIASKIKKITKKRRRGQRGRALRNNSCISVGHIRSCPPLSIKQETKLKYHCRISGILEQNEFENSKSWKPNDLHCTVCSTTVTSKKSLAQHFKSTKHKHKIWNCTPNYCSPCGIYQGFCTENFRKPLFCFVVTSQLLQSCRLSNGSLVSTDLPVR